MKGKVVVYSDYYKRIFLEGLDEFRTSHLHNANHMHDLFCQTIRLDKYTSNKRNKKYKIFLSALLMDVNNLSTPLVAGEPLGIKTITQFPVMKQVHVYHFTTFHPTGPVLDPVEHHM
jgi:hypothetical protein